MTVSAKVAFTQNNCGAVIKAISGAGLLRLARLAGAIIQAFARMNASSGRPGLNVVTGNLVNSIQVMDAESTESTGAVDVGPTVEYGAIHEFGGLITPVHARMLAIPLPGVQGSPSSYDLHVVSFGGQVSLVDKQGNIKFILKQSVYIPPRPYMRPAVDNHEQEILDAVGNEVKNMLDGVAS